MNILVYDIAASESGTLSILLEYYNALLKKNEKNVNYIFVVSVPLIYSKENITVLRYPWIKKSWFHRIFFDLFFANKIVKKYRASKVYSLQNLPIPFCEKEQIIYLHTPVPFSNHRFNLFTDTLLWTYKNIIGYIIKKYINKAEKIIVQTTWMKEAVVRQCHVNKEKILVEMPRIDTKQIVQYRQSNGVRTFFYPAIPVKYKNHKVILEACKILGENYKRQYRIIFTFNGNENIYARKIRKQAERENLPIEFKGVMERKNVFHMYSKSILLFPSYLETFGMPLLEAKLSGTPILASDMPFSREILDGYDKVSFFCYKNKEELSRMIKTKILEEI